MYLIVYIYNACALPRKTTNTHTNTDERTFLKVLSVKTKVTHYYAANCPMDWLPFPESDGRSAGQETPCLLQNPNVFTFASFEALTAVMFQVQVFRIVMLCNVVVGYQRFRSPCCLHLQCFSWL